VLLDKPWLATAGARMTDGSQWFEYVRNYGRLFSGVTIYKYFSGPHLIAPIYGAASVLVAIAVALGMVRRLRRTRSPLDVGLVFGWATMWLAFFASRVGGCA
jgi:ABC-type spermidine/putrescine transport system permease subunit I